MREGHLTMPQGIVINEGILKRFQLIEESIGFYEKRDHYKNTIEDAFRNIPTRHGALTLLTDKTIYLLKQLF
jgi:hypothetical protein